MKVLRINELVWSRTELSLSDTEFAGTISPSAGTEDRGFTEADILTPAGDLGWMYSGWHKEDCNKTSVWSRSWAFDDGSVTIGGKGCSGQLG